ncbi:unnamed protein product [Macrosiphum euphorbiae]|uniref:Uncharacterized protein n=1 Tax=Macrosiphum euphorbiae TaxID=13131 RepID=A0AAV0Y7H3_9HEMI|nr:unnamed protein product [Macrosiphum euphorbiae]
MNNVREYKCPMGSLRRWLPCHCWDWLSSASGLGLPEWTGCSLLLPVLRRWWITVVVRGSQVVRGSWVVSSASVIITGRLNWAGVDSPFPMSGGCVWCRRAGGVSSRCRWLWYRQ